MILGFPPHYFSSSRSSKYFHFIPIANNLKPPLSFIQAIAFLTFLLSALTFIIFIILYLLLFQSFLKLFLYFTQTFIIYCIPPFLSHSHPPQLL